MNPLTGEALRYLRAGPDDGRALALVEEALRALEPVRPRHVLRVFPVQEVLALFGSASLRAHLTGCAEVALLAATLGAEADRMIRRAETIDMPRAAALHACAAAKIEAHCDAAQAVIPGAERPRFSPGYGDFSLAAQRPLLDALDAGRRIGLYLTDGGMLVPVKSVTAVLGLGPAPEGCAQDKCARCGKADCAFRGQNT